MSSGKVNMFSALSGAAEKKAKKKAQKKALEPEPLEQTTLDLPPPTAETLSDLAMDNENWGDVSDEEEEDEFYSPGQNIPHALESIIQRQIDKGLLAPEETILTKKTGDSDEEDTADDDSSDEDDSEDDEDKNSNVEKNQNEEGQTKTASGALNVASKPPIPAAPKLTKAEQQKKELDDLDALLNEMSIENSKVKETELEAVEEAPLEGVEKVIATQNAAAADFLASAGLNVQTETSKKKKKNKNRNKNKSPASGGGEATPTEAAQDETAAEATEEVDIKKILANKNKKGKKKVAASATAAAEAEAKARQAKMKKKKKDKSAFNHVPLK